MPVPVFDKSKPMPTWLKQYKGRRGRYWRRLWNAQPLYADKDAMRRIYKNAARMRKAGHDVVVDHIIPLHGGIVCGLHIETNLRIISAAYNQQIGSHQWPGCPFEQADMFGIPDGLKMFGRSKYE